MGIPRAGLFAGTDSIRRALPVAGVVAQATDGRVWMANDAPAGFRGPLEDYRLLQYDLLLGEQYALRHWACEESAIAPSDELVPAPSAPVEPPRGPGAILAGAGCQRNAT
jgi:hypothetical protein